MIAQTKWGNKTNRLWVIRLKMYYKLAELAAQGTQPQLRVPRYKCICVCACVCGYIHWVDYWQYLQCKVSKKKKKKSFISCHTSHQGKICNDEGSSIKSLRITLYQTGKKFFQLRSGCKSIPGFPFIFTFFRKLKVSIFILYEEKKYRAWRHCPSGSVF